MVVLRRSIGRKKVKFLFGNFKARLNQRFLNRLTCFLRGGRGGWYGFMAVRLTVDVVNVLALLQDFQGFGNQRRNRPSGFA